MPFPDDNSFPDTLIRPDGSSLPDGRITLSFFVNDLIFKEVLKKDFIKDLFNENTLATEIQDYFNHVAKLEKDVAEMKLEAPDWEHALTLWIEKIENDLLNAGYRFELEGGINMISKVAYDDRAMGRRAPLYSYVGLIFTNYFECLRLLKLALPESTTVATDLLFIERFKKGVEHISYGVALAIKLPQWKKDLLKLQSQKSNEPHEVRAEIEDTTPLPKKLKWTGTPSQFGFIIDLLIKFGYVKKPPGGYKKNAEFYLTIFDIITTPGNLENEINQNRNSLSEKNAVKFTIPHMDDAT